MVISEGDPRNLLSLARCRRQIGIPEDDTGSDADITEWIQEGVSECAEHLGADILDAQRVVRANSVFRYERVRVNRRWITAVNPLVSVKYWLSNDRLTAEPDGDLPVAGLVVDRDERGISIAPPEDGWPGDDPRNLRITLSVGR